MESRKEIIFASGNSNKVAEIASKLGDKYVVRGLKDMGITEDIPETANTLEGNASIKSHYLYNKLGCDCFSDDTGLEVEVLGGEPGVRSARYAGEEGDAEKNMDKLLGALSGASNRRARFRTVISLILDGEEHLFEGIVEGLIVEEKRGDKGFGYDPIFVPNGYRESFAEMPLEEKNKISHRARAVEKLIKFLNDR